MMNDTQPSKNTSLELQVLGFILNKPFYDRVKNIVTRDIVRGALRNAVRYYIVWAKEL